MFWDYFVECGFCEVHLKHLLCGVRPASASSSALKTWLMSNPSSNRDNAAQSEHVDKYHKRLNAIRMR